MSTGFLEHALEMPNRSDVVIKYLTPLEDFRADAPLKVRVANHFYCQSDVSIVCLRDQLGHSHAAQYAACQPAPEKSPFTSDGRQPRLDGLNGRVVTGESNRIERDMRAPHKTVENVQWLGRYEAYVTTEVQPR